MGSKEEISSKREITFRKKGAPVTLLIPEQIVRLRKLRADKLNQELSFLLKKYQKSALEKKFLGRSFPAVSYQRKGLKLKKMNFRPNEKDWVALGVLALGLGVSRCLLFAILEEWECTNEISYYQTGGALTKITLLREILLAQNRFFSQLFPSSS
ncbi:PF07600 family protein [Leptospira weilii serovar Topaz str. LT2116]|uniref:PF07600 family protein n=1 Tax=Leptospira weilii serovar Topaz str. LT2116 TaxID=1088540 RepID=M3EMA2_9LEPT|nr:PF07600 family protein [Leptospira weilii serovar Topaz str. LT2116]